MEIKRIPSSISINHYKISFSYETRKGTYREQQRAIKTTSEKRARESFLEWVKMQRTMINVKILSIVKTDIETIYL